MKELAQAAVASVAEVQVRHVSHVYEKSGASGSYPVLSGIDLDLRRGEFFCLLGPSGCGKSTILRMVAGFLPATSGEILIRGKTVKGPGADRGVVFQGEAALFNWLTAAENVAFGLRMRKVLPDDRKRVVDEHLHLVGLKEFEANYPRQLSGGMRQRIQIARVLANDPDILLMDEPFGALDAQTRGILQQELSRIWSTRRKTVLFITHDIEEAILLGDRIGVMSAGPAARMRTVIDVDLSRPREINSDFIELRRQIRSVIDEEASKSMRMIKDVDD